MIAFFLSLVLALAPVAPRVHRILFIGNSLTYVNDLPGTLAILAATPEDSIQVALVARPNLALIDHVHGESNAMARIKEGGWDYVVLQQGPTSRAIDRDTFVIAARILDEQIRKVGAKTVIYMVWPAEERLEFIDSVIASHRAVADSIHALLVPAGEAWKMAFEKDEDVGLYDVDAFHPSPLGTYLVALTFYECMLKGDARLLPRRAVVDGKDLRASLEVFRLVQQSAHNTAARTCHSRKK